MLSAEFLAWGMFLGVGCLFLASAFRPAGIGIAIMTFLAASGALGPMSRGDPLKTSVLTTVGMIGWGPGLTASVLLATIWLARQRP